MSKVVVLGCGMVGSAIAIDLARKHEVTVTDVNASAFDKLDGKSQITKTILDVTDTLALIEFLQDFDLVVCAVPGFLGYETLKTILTAGKDVVDISFFPEDALELDGLARKHRCTAIVDCGVAPGMGNVILGHYNETLTIDTFTCLVGGLPKEQVWPFKYKAPFSPIDVIEEYTRPARYVENGELRTVEPLTDRELVDFDSVGVLESFNSDGLRSLLTTMKHIPNMKEKTLRYPGHAEYISVLKSAGFFDTAKREINGVEVRPIDLTNALLFDAWKLGIGEPEFTVMRIDMHGTDDGGKRMHIRYDLYDEYNEVSNTSSMARTTGYTATAAVELVLQGLFNAQGVFPPELVGKHKACFNFIHTYLQERNVNYVKTETVE